MKKNYNIYVDCANCALKMENKIKKVDGVNSASINFMAQTLDLDINDENSDAIIKKVAKACKKVEPDCELK